MKKVYVLTRYPSRFADIHEFLIKNGYSHEQSWEKSEEDVKRLKSLKVQWTPQHTQEDVVSIASMGPEDVETMEFILRGNCGEWQVLPDIFIVDLNLLFSMTAEHVYQLVVHSLREMHSGDIPQNFRFMYVINKLGFNSIETAACVGSVDWVRGTEFHIVHDSFLAALKELEQRPERFKFFLEATEDNL